MASVFAQVTDDCFSPGKFADLCRSDRIRYSAAMFAREMEACSSTLALRPAGGSSMDAGSGIGSGNGGRTPSGLGIRIGWRRGRPTGAAGSSARRDLFLTSTVELSGFFAFTGIS